MGAEFPEHSSFIWYLEDERTKPIHTEGAILWDDGNILPIAKVEPSLTLEAGTRELSYAEVAITDVNGGRSKLSATRISRGIYGRGEWSGEGFYDDLGPYHEEGEIWNLNERDTLLELGRWLRQAPCRFEHQGAIGYGAFEYAVSRRHQRYGLLL